MPTDPRNHRLVFLITMKDLNSKHKRTVVPRPKRVFVVDAFSLSRKAVSRLLEETPGFVLCGEADSAARALRAIGRLKPDVVLTEILLHQDFEMIHKLRKRYPRLPILVFSYRDEDWYAPHALEAGADGFLAKGVTAGELRDGLYGVTEGRMVLSPRIRARFLAKCISNRSRPDPQRTRWVRRIVIRKRKRAALGRCRWGDKTTLRTAPAENRWTMGDQFELVC